MNTRNQEPPKFEEAGAQKISKGGYLAGSSMQEVREPSPNSQTLNPDPQQAEALNCPEDPDNGRRKTKWCDASV